MTADHHGLPMLCDKRRRRRTAAAATAALAALLATFPAVPSAAAADVVAILTLKNNSCGSWVSQRSARGQMLLQFEQWAVGFASGIAVWASSDYLKGLDHDAVFGWLDNYCRAHPLESLADALTSLAFERGLRPH